LSYAQHTIVSDRGNARIGGHPERDAGGRRALAFLAALDASPRIEIVYATAALDDDTADGLDLSRAN